MASVQRGAVDVFDVAARLIADVWPHDAAGSEMHLGDLAWGVHRQTPATVESLRLWPSIDDPQALTKYDGRGVCDLVVRRTNAGYEAAIEAIAWAERECESRAPEGADGIELRVGRRIADARLIELLVERGFRRCTGGFPALARTLEPAAVPDIAVPRGYAIRRLHSDEIGARCGCFEAAFPREPLSIESYRALQACSIYEPRLDVVAVSASGEVAAFATLWLDRVNRVAQIEPAGCDPQHRRRGLTRSAILTALAAARDLGAESALVRHGHHNVAARRLYQACGFRVESDLAGFAKQINLGRESKGATASIPPMRDNGASGAHPAGPQGTVRNGQDRASAATSGHTPRSTYGSEGWGFESLPAR